jgi:uncharacterized cupin superfamily protein
MAQRRHPNVVNLEEAEGRSMGEGTKFGSTRKMLGLETGSKGIGCSWTEVQPGKSAFPRHWHSANEESIFVLEGEGTLKMGDKAIVLRANDYATLPTGPDHAHIFTNTGTKPLRYLCFSTISTVEAVGYPDSKKIGVASAASYDSAMKGQHWVRMLTFESSQTGYWDGEDVG